MELDHLVWAHPDLDVAAAWIARRFGVSSSGGGQHPGQGTRNKLLGLGGATYLEILATDPSQAEANRPDLPEGGGFVAWALACDDIESTVETLRARGFDAGPVVDRERRGPDGELLRWQVAFNEANDDLVPFLISWGDTPHPSLHAPRGLTLESVRVEHPEPEPIAAALAVLGCDVTVREAPEAALVAVLSGPEGVHELR